MACNCADQVDEKLAERNTVLDRAWVVKSTTPNNPNLMLQTSQIERGRGKAKAAAVFITYCPFCGVKYDDA
jgi:hypothetical protein